MGRNIKKLQSKARYDQDAVDHWEEFIEVILGSDAHKRKDQLDYEDIDEDIIDNLVGELVGEQVENSHDKGYEDRDRTNHLVGCR